MAKKNPNTKSKIQTQHVNCWIQVYIKMFSCFTLLLDMEIFD